MERNINTKYQELNRENKFHKSKSKVSIKPTKQFTLKLTKKNKFGKSSKGISNMNSKVSTKNSRVKKIRYSRSK